MRHTSVKWSVFAGLILLSACAGPEYSYRLASDSVADPPNGLRFSLETGSLTFQTATPPAKPDNSAENPVTQNPNITPNDLAAGKNKQKSNPPAGGTPTQSASTPPATKPSGTTPPDTTKGPKTVTATATVVDNCISEADANWSDKCFKGVPSTVSVTAVALDKDGDYVATPADAAPAYGTSSSISAGPVVAGETYLYQNIKFGVTDNTSKTITGIGAGITGGLLFGPIGGVVGGVVAAIAPAIESKFNQLDSASSDSDKQTAETLEISAMKNYVCYSKRSELDFSALPSTKMALGLPLVLKTSDSIFGDEADENPDHGATSTAKDISGCWSPLPNALRITNAAPVQMDLTSQNFKAIATADPEKAELAPIPGDGWFYRIVVNENPPGYDLTKARDDIAAGKIPKSEFPTSFCRRDAYLEITWWDDLAKHAYNTTAQLNIVRFKIDKFPDPTRILPVAIPHSGGSISFDSSCGATPTTGSPTDYSTDVNAFTSQVQSLQKALSGSKTTAAAAAAGKPKAATPPAT